MRRVFGYLKDRRREAVLAPLFKLIEASFDLVVPLVVARIINQGIAMGDTGYIVRQCLLLILLGAAGLAFSITAQYFAARAAVGFATKLRHALFEKIQSLSFAQLDTVGASTLLTRMTSDINQVQSGVNLTLRLFLRSPFIVFGAMAMAFTIDAKAALVFAVAIPLLCVAVFGIMLWTMPYYRKVQSRLDGVVLALRENLTGVRVLRAFCREKQETDAFEEKNQALSRMQLRAGRISALMNPLTYVLVNLAVLLLVYVGGKRVESGHLVQGDVVALYNYMAQILVELVKLANLIVTITKAVACAGRLESVLAMEPDLQSALPQAPDAPQALRGKVEFRNVSLRYPGAGADALSKISFCAQPGQTIGVIGGTGAGKSSLVQLIAHFYDATDGTVLVDGCDVKSLDPAVLRRRIGFVPQKATLFHGTIRENLRWGDPEATEQALWDALRTAQAAQIVQEKDGGLDAAVEQGGKNFSGGQKQRLTIARALVRRPEILILDDSASALDYATDARLRKALQQLPDRPTVFVVSQRTASLQHADQILVLEDGALCGIGTHAQLLESCPVYREIYDSQFAKGETHHAQ